MKHFFLVLIAFFYFSTNKSQSNFDNGYKKGFQEGYCFNKSIGCIEPISPIAPIPKIGENMNSYTDGYNRGFNDGLEKQKKESSNINSNDRERYKTTKSTFIDDFIYQPNYDLMLQLLEMKQ